MNFSRKEFLRLGAALVTSAAGVAMTSSCAAVEAKRDRPPTARRTLIRGADVLTMDVGLRELPNTDVLIEDGRIVEIGVNLNASSAHIVDARGMILMPGMIDGHRHVWQCIEAGRMVKTDGGSYYRNYQTWKVRTMACLTAEDHHLAAYVGGLQALNSGVTSLLDYAHGQQTPERAHAAARGLKDSGIGGWFTYQVSHTTSFGPGDTVSLAAVEAERTATSSEAHFQTLASLQKAHFSDSSAPLQLGMAMSVGALGAPIGVAREEIARARSMGIKMIAWHSNPPRTPTPPGTFGAHGSGIVDLREAGLLGPDLHLSHGNELTREELEILRDSGGMLCSTTMGEFVYPGAGRPPSVHGRARKEGVAAGIGLDVALAMEQDYFEHIRNAFWSLFLSKEGAEIAATYKSPDTLDFATRLGARAIRLGDVAGSVAVGKRADLVLLRTDRIGFADLGSLADRVVNFGSQADVDSVWVAGRLVKSGGTMLGVDWKSLKERVRAVQTRITEQGATIHFT